MRLPCESIARLSTMHTGCQVDTTQVSLLRDNVEVLDIHSKIVCIGRTEYESELDNTVAYHHLNIHTSG
jgi:hypothetical protein